ncbi:MAG: diguanylate cyclase [Mariprofundaceae bacterium]
MANAMLLELGQEQIATFCGELGHAIAAHDEWVHQFHVALVTVKKIPMHYIEKNSHATSSFGIWLEQNREFVDKNDDLKVIENIHLLMHEEAKKLSYLYNNEEPIEVKDYNAFIEHKVLLEQIIHDLEDSLRFAGTMFDPLTNVFNRQAMNPLLKQEQARINRQGHQSSVAMVDLDYFKSVNDTYGHLAGDRVLRTSAEFFKGHIRSHDSIFRYGGEEFLICIPYASPDAACELMDRIRDSLSKFPVRIDADRVIHVTASIGIAELTADEAIEGCISRADQALYAAKESGRNRVVHAGSLDVSVSS